MPECAECAESVYSMQCLLTLYLTLAFFASAPLLRIHDSLCRWLNDIYTEFAALCVRRENSILYRNSLTADYYYCYCCSCIVVARIVDSILYIYLVLRIQFEQKRDCARAVNERPFASSLFFFVPENPLQLDVAEAESDDGEVSSGLVFRLSSIERSETEPGLRANNSTKVETLTFGIRRITVLLWRLL